MDINPFAFIGFTLIIGVMAIAMIRSLQEERSTDILQQWATENGYEVLSQKSSEGPFAGKLGRGQEAYYITVRHITGEQISGWIKLGSWGLGIHSNQVEVIWDE